jgi:hypothetical protein
LIGLRTVAPIFNLAVSSYGTARELLRARRHPQFNSAKCILIHYNRNDLEENEGFVSPEGLPRPTPTRFEFLLQSKPRRLSFFGVLTESFRYIWTLSTNLWANAIARRSALWVGPGSASSATGKTPGGNLNTLQHVELFLAVLSRFTELGTKTILFIAGAEAPDRFLSVLAGTPDHFLLALMARPDLPKNIVPIGVKMRYDYFYTLDMHLNKLGIGKLQGRCSSECKKLRRGKTA